MQKIPHLPYLLKEGARPTGRGRGELERCKTHDARKKHKIKLCANLREIRMVEEVEEVEKVIVILKAMGDRLKEAAKLEKGKTV